LKAGILTHDGQVKDSATGTPQGGSSRLHAARRRTGIRQCSPREGGQPLPTPLPCYAPWLHGYDDLDVFDGADVAEVLGLPGLEAPAGRTVILLGMPAFHLDTYTSIGALSEVGAS
jgi:hypothetical protein